MSDIENQNLSENLILYEEEIIQTNLSSICIKLICIGLSFTFVIVPLLISIILYVYLGNGGNPILIIFEFYIAIVKSELEWISYLLLCKDN